VAETHLTLETLPVSWLDGPLGDQRLLELGYGHAITGFIGRRLADGLPGCNPSVQRCPTPPFSPFIPGENMGREGSWVVINLDYPAFQEMLSVALGPFDLGMPLRKFLSMLAEILDGVIETTQETLDARRKNRKTPGPNGDSGGGERSNGGALGSPG